MSHIFGGKTPNDLDSLSRRSFFTELDDVRSDVNEAFGSLEQFQNPVVGKSIYVSKAGNDTTGLGSIAQPFLTVQAAIDYAETLTIPGTSDKYSIYVQGGRYEEALVVRKPNIDLVSTGPSKAWIAGTADNPALTLTNATKASLATYRGSGTYSDLVNQGDAGPTGTGVSEFLLQAGSGANAVELLGVKGDDTADTTNFGQFGISFTNVYTSGSLYCRNTKSMSWRIGRVSTTSTFLQCGNVNIRRGEFKGAYTVAYDIADSEGYTASGFSKHTSHFAAYYGKVTVGIGVTLTGNDHYIDNELEINDTGATDVDRIHVTGDLDINGASGNVLMHNPYIGGAITAVVDKTMTLNNPHIVGAVTLDNGAGAVVFNGGQYMGALTDVGVRLTHNLGNIGT